MKRYMRLLSKTFPQRRVAYGLAAAVALVVVPAVIATHGQRGQAVSAGELYLSPSSGTYKVGSTVAVQVRENSGSIPVIAAQVDMSYSQNSLQYASTNFSAS